MGIITVGLSPLIPGWLNAAPEIRDTAGQYFAIVSLPMLFRASSIIFASALRASGNTRTPMLVSLAMNAINVVLNFLLIFPGREISLLGARFFMPGAGLGVVGAAIATAVSYVASGLMMFRALWRSPALSPKGQPLRWDRAVMGQCARVGVPVVFTRIGVSLGHVVFLSQVSVLGTVSLAAHSLALTTEEAVYLPGYGMQAAASTLAGNAVGEGSEAKLMGVSPADSAGGGAADDLHGSAAVPVPGGYTLPVHPGPGGHRPGSGGAAHHCRYRAHLCRGHYLGGRVQRRGRHPGALCDLHGDHLGSAHSADRPVRACVPPGASRRCGSAWPWTTFPGRRCWARGSWGRAGNAR